MKYSGSSYFKQLDKVLYENLVSHSNIQDMARLAALANHWDKWMATGHYHGEAKTCYATHTEFIIAFVNGRDFDSFCEPFMCLQNPDLP